MTEDIAEAPVMYIKPDDVQCELVDNVEQVVTQYFALEPSEKQYPVIEELLRNLVTFGQQNLTPSGICVLFTVITDIHHFNIQHNEITYQQLSQYAAERISQYALEIPPLYKSVIQSKEVLICSSFIDNYLRNFKLFRYLFKPVNLLKVTTHGAIDVLTVESMQQLGQPIHEPVVDPKGKAVQQKPDSKLNARSTKTGQSGLDETVVKKLVNITVLPLKDAKLYVAPLPPTVQEVRSQQIQQITETVKKEQEIVQIDKKVDIDKFNEIIELQVQQEMDKLKTKIQVDLTVGDKKRK